MLYLRVVELSTDVVSGEVYILAKFWKTRAARGRDDKPHLIEDFIMQLRLTGTRPVNPNNPGEGMVIYNRNIKAEIRNNIRLYIEEAERLRYEGDNTSGSDVTGDSFSVGGVEIRGKGVAVDRPRMRDMSDPHDVLAKPEVAILRGKNMDL